jgi:hypothetical protein
VFHHSPEQERVSGDSLNGFHEKFAQTYSILYVCRRVLYVLRVA